MNKLASYLATGKGLGLKIVLAMSVVLTLITSIYFYYAILRPFQQSPATVDFVENFPVLEVKDGSIQDTELQWARMIPFTQTPLIINTAKDELEEIPSVANATYITRTRTYTIVNKEVEEVVFADHSLLKNTKLTPGYFLPISWGDLVKGALVFFFGTWISFLVCVGIVALLAWIFRISLKNKRVWRVVAVTTLFCFIATVIFALIPFTRTWTLMFVNSNLAPIAVQVLINLAVLARLRKD